MSIDMYWLDDHDARYSTFLRVIQAYLHPEINRPEDLLLAAGDPGSTRMKTFKREFRDVIADPGVLPWGAIDTATEHEEDSNEAFLANLWKYLYGDEPATGQ